MEITKIKDITGTNLDGFELKTMIEVYTADEDGAKLTTAGFFHDQGIAEAYKRLSDNSGHLNLKNTLVLTNGEIGLIIESNAINKVFNEEKVILELKDKTLNSLDPTTRKILGI